ncbi:hypothetical protein FPANT_3581 [Fusarium pseudoanthophilum]|uniref:Uncharacterized protein n=1 Tax=Fusarium pseudoanthophilum TaxID=48495 RepID=A0A8H5UV39_9HYPO|nr:hypothetical protein FPANT_3581 [Fusarium pseudoanthophilum]
MLPVESKDLERLVKFNSILILDVDCWGVSYLRNILAHGSAHITTKQGNKTLPPELWLDILDRVEYYIDENTYKPVYGVAITPGSTNGSGTESALVCNVLENWRKCGDITYGNMVSLYHRCIDIPSYKLDPKKHDVDQDEEPFFNITKTVQGNAYSIPVSHLRFQGDFLFDNVEVPDMIARCEDGWCSLCGGDRYLESARPSRREEALMFCNETEFHRQCYWHGVVCPLCIGGEYADAYLEILKSSCRNCEYDDVEKEEETEEERLEKKRTRNWIRERYRDLGYGRFSDF